MSLLIIKLYNEEEAYSSLFIYLFVSISKRLPYLNDILDYRFGHMKCSTV